MRSNQERIRLMHARTAWLQRKKDRGRLITAGGISMSLFVVLLGLTLYLQGLTGGYTEGRFAASSLLSESAGGYVLVAVIFFMLGVLISALLFRYRRRKRHSNNSDLGVNKTEGADK